jgi:hypothetical protein
MTKHNTDDEHHPLKPFWNPKDQVEQIAKLPEFEKLHEAFQDEPSPIFSDQSGLKKNRRIYRFLELAYPFLQSDQDAEAYIEEQQTSSKLRKFLDNMSNSVSNNGSAVIINPSVGGSVVKTVTTTSHNSTVKETALKKTIQQLEDRISQIRRQLGE